MSTGVDTWDAGDAPGRIYTNCPPAGGRKVAGSNPVAPTSRKPASRAGFRHLGHRREWGRASAVVPAVVPSEAGTDLGKVAGSNRVAPTSETPLRERVPGVATVLFPALVVPAVAPRRSASGPPSAEPSASQAPSLDYSCVVARDISGHLSDPGATHGLRRGGGFRSSPSVYRAAPVFHRARMPSNPREWPRVAPETHAVGRWCLRPARQPSKAP